ncbi:uncharacterized protein LOC143033549 [Oratosquilla oratoria]|uniref:uncharacterized protein LOC143033549 n=1 Tax=Oratosquilla oratoria TaxID=337810 RepID=UPI003F760D34
MISSTFQSLSAAPYIRPSRVLKTLTACFVKHPHDLCSRHTPCFSQAGVVCKARVEESRAAPPKTRSKLAALELLREAWRRARKLKSADDPPPLVWADPALGVELGLVRPRHPSPYVSETSVGAQPGPLGVQGDESDVAEYGVPERPQASRQPHTSDHQGSLKPLRLALSSTPTNSSSSLVHSREPGRKSRSKKRSASPRSRTLSLSPPSTASPPNSPSLPRSPFPRRKSHKGREPEDETRGEGTLAAQVAALLPSLIGPVLESALSHYPAFQAAQIKTHPSPEQPPIEPTALAPPPTLPPGPSLRPSVPATGIGLEGPSQEEPPNQTSVGLDGVEDHYSSSLPYPPTMTDSFEFRPFSWCDLPRSWEYSFGEGHKLVAWSPDYSLPEGWRRRDDVILKWANDEEGAKVLYKLLTTEASTRQDLASTISTVTAIAMMRNWLTTLATSFEDFPREELRHTLAALSTVAEGTANMASSALPPAARAFTAARLAARQSATRSAPEIARRGVVRAAPLSRGLFDQEATDRVFATVPTVIQIQQPSQPSETMEGEHFLQRAVFLLALATGYRAIDYDQFF